MNTNIRKLTAEEFERECAPDNSTLWMKYIEPASDLLARQFPQTKWAVPDLLSEGATLFVGAPKVGKSNFAIDVSLAIATGGYALGKIPVEQGDVLYLAMEDGEKRMKKRLSQRLEGSQMPKQL